jgi:hypothetical protein
MTFDQATLPRDPDRLIEIIVDLQDPNVATLRRAVFGPRSEKLLVVDRAQLRLELNACAVHRHHFNARNAISTGWSRIPIRSFVAS